MQSTEYVIWTNFHAKKTDRDVQAYQLAAMVLDRFGVHDGTILRYHQSHGYDETGSETFQNGLCMLEYDMLYGKHYATGGEAAVQPMELHFGVDEITLTGVSSSDGGLTVHGHELHAVQRSFWSTATGADGVYRRANAGSGGYVAQSGEGSVRCTGLRYGYAQDPEPDTGLDRPGGKSLVITGPDAAPESRIGSCFILTRVRRAPEYPAGWRGGGPALSARRVGRVLGRAGLHRDDPAQQLVRIRPGRNDYKLTGLQRPVLGAVGIARAARLEFHGAVKQRPRRGGCT